jgi:TolB protein
LPLDWRALFPGIFMKWQAVWILFLSACFADEVFDLELEKECLTHIVQVTSESMGFTKAGESYFSPDGQSLIFQAVPDGEIDYQIYTIDLSTGVLKRVSTGFGACTCGYYKSDGSKIIFASSHESPLPLHEHLRV